ncbi:DUF5719 family protein [Arthrobacter mangrovi]|uniref:Secreted protein n=1 Tax=Arthrobacter mangrovi TaxID=2966350 RepID=A0ABQ5MNN9_9MICC|nr:DUF5719 family protein [Arthrobacter mangrovi]GLB65608.1 hypothetical protein AHIS1636_00470 [Arthrobacter mangrovi]
MADKPGEEQLPEPDVAPAQGRQARKATREAEKARAAREATRDKAAKAADKAQAAKEAKAAKKARKTGKTDKAAAAAQADQSTVAGQADQATAAGQAGEATAAGAAATAAAAGPPDMDASASAATVPPAGSAGSDPVPASAPDSSGSSAIPGAGGEPRNARRKGPLLGAAAGVGVLLLGVGAVAAGSFFEPPRGAAQLDPISAAVPAGNLTAVCPEPLKLLDSAADEVDPEFSPVSKTAVTKARATVFSDLGGTIPGSALTELGADSPLIEIADFTGKAGSSGSNEAGETKVVAKVVAGQDITAPTVLSVEPLGEQHARAGAAMSYTASDGDLRGLAAANCLTPSNDFWLLGASTTVGASSVLNLYNASETPSTVDLELIGSKGPIQAAGSRGLLLAPGESRSWVLAGLAAGQESLAVHVSSSGGAVAGTIQQSVLRGLTPGGVELLQPGNGPGLREVVTGIEVQDAKVARQIRGQSGYEKAAPALEVVVPGSGDATLEVRLFGPKGQVELPGGGVLTAAGGSVLSIPLDSLPAGTYSADISSNVSINAAARVSRGTGTDKPVDFGWAPSSGRLGSEHLAVLPPAGSSKLSFTAPDGDAQISLRPVDVKGNIGAERKISVPAGTTVTADAKDGGDPAALLVSATGDAVYGSQVVTNGSKPDISVLPIPQGTQGQQSVPVVIGY